MTIFARAYMRCVLFCGPRQPQIGTPDGDAFVWDMGTLSVTMYFSRPLHAEHGFGEFSGAGFMARTPAFMAVVSDTEHVHVWDMREMGVGVGCTAVPETMTHASPSPAGGGVEVVENFATLTPRDIFTNDGGDGMYARGSWCCGS